MNQPNLNAYNTAIARNSSRLSHKFFSLPRAQKCSSRLNNIILGFKGIVCYLQNDFHFVGLGVKESTHCQEKNRVNNILLPHHCHPSPQPPISCLWLSMAVNLPASVDCVPTTISSRTLALLGFQPLDFEIFFFSFLEDGVYSKESDYT